jgi:hypothetical protein
MGYGGTYKLKGRKYTAKFKTNKTGEITGFKQIVPEHELQAELMRWAKRYEDNYPELWLLHAIPNGGKRNVKDAVKLKREGVKAGVPDLFMPVARMEYHGLYIEMKNTEGRLTERQREWQERLKKQNYAVLTCHSDIEAKAQIVKYLNSQKTIEQEGYDE